MGGGRVRGRRAAWAAVALSVWSLSACLHAEDISHKSLFEESAFDLWQTQAPREEIPWKIQLFPARLSIHQRLEAGLEIHLPIKELAARRADGRIVVLLQVTDAARHRHRTAHILDLKSIAADASSGDLPIAWSMFVLPGEYEVAVALNDKASGEHNFQETTLRVAPLTHDPLPGLWRGLPSVEFLSPVIGGLDRLYRTDVKSHISLPVATKRPLHLEILADLTPSEMFHGDPAQYERFLAGVLPIVKALSQMRPIRGSVTVSALDLERHRITAEQSNLDELRWSPWKESLATGNASMVPVQTLMERRHSPVFLREEIVRRVETAAEAPAPAGDPLVVFVIVGGPMDSYSFPDLPPLALPREATYAALHLQYDFQGSVASKMATGNAGKLEKMLRPMRTRTFTVHSAESARQALAGILEEISRM